MVLGGARTVAEVMHKAAQARVLELQLELKKARAALQVTGKALAREKALQTRSELKAQEQKVGKVKKTVGKADTKVRKGVAVKGAGRPKDVPAPVGERRRGRPLRVAGVCNQCRRLAEGEAGGHDHAWFCPKVKYARL